MRSVFVIIVYPSRMLTDGADLSAVSARLFEGLLWGRPQCRRALVALLKMDEREAYASQRGDSQRTDAHVSNRWNSNKQSGPLHRRANKAQRCERGRGAAWNFEADER